MHGLRSIFDHAVRLTGAINGFPNCESEISGHVDLKAQLAAETYAKQQQGHAADSTVRDAHVWHRRSANVDSLDQGLEYPACVGSLYCNDRPMFGRGCEPYLEVRPFGLPIVFHHREYARRTAGGRGYVEAVGLHARNHAVVIDKAV